MVIDVADIDDVKEVLEDKDKEEKFTKKIFPLKSTMNPSSLFLICS